MKRIGSAVTGGLVFSALLFFLGALSVVQAAEPRRVDFDHFQTGFPLGGQHARISCESCHIGGIFKGTPNQCSGCHSPGSRIAVSVKPANHLPTNAPCDQCHTSTVTWFGARYTHLGVLPGSCGQCHNGNVAPGKPLNHTPTTQPCDACHRTTAWIPASFNHATVAPGTCAQCHNGSQAIGKPANHIQTTASCDTCHRTSAWLPASFNHASVTPGTCGQCHNGSQATGKPANHIQTTASCDTCHRTTAWVPATFNHASVTPGTCAQCHNGSQARGKPANHIQTTASCDACHNTTAWIPANFNHASVTPGTCAQCHNGSQATGKPSGHFVTTRSCDACHSTTAWTPVLRYTHVSPNFKPHNAGVTCAQCHTGNTETISWPFAAYQPDCAGCHASRYQPGAHTKTTSPTTIRYTVSELRNCAGSCHIYTDSTFTTIRTTRSSHHRSTDGGF